MGGKCLGIVRKLLAFGTGQLVAVGYMDRENWGHRPGRGAQFYYMLLSRIISSLMAIFLAN